MSSESFHKILEPYLLAMGLTVLILLGAFFLLYRDGRKVRHNAPERAGVQHPVDDGNST